MSPQEEEYIVAHSMPEPPAMARLYRDTHLHRLYSRMCCDPLQGRVLVMLTKMIKPRRILELGTFSGYSALCFAEGMPAGAELHTVEIDDEAEPALRRVFGESPRSADIHLHIGDALEVVDSISAEPWDLVYIDANKRIYTEYYERVFPHVSPGGYILADNTLWSDAVLDPARNDAQTAGIRAFNDRVAADPRVETVMLLLYDGLTIIRKKTDEEENHL